jgi:GST-like protein
MKSRSYRLIGSPGCGSVLVEAALTLAGLPFELEDIAFEALGPEHPRLGKLNPLGQVPVLVLPDGGVMTESAAIVLYLAEVAPAAGLAPAPGDPQRSAFLRWLLTLVGAIYPTFTYGDFPERYVPAGTAAKQLVASSLARRQLLWTHVEAAAGAPWFLGERFSALDLYVGAMTRWRPRRAWFAANAPKLAAIAARVDGLPALARAWRRNFGN